MKPTLTPLAALVVLLTVMTATSAQSPVLSADSPVLRILNWSEYIVMDEKPDDVASEDWEKRPITRRSPVLREFARRAKCRIEYVEYESSNQAFATVRARPGFFDVVIGDESLFDNLVNAKLLRAHRVGVDRKKAIIPKSLEGPVGDKAWERMMPYLIGMQGILWRHDVLGEMKGWKDLLIAPDKSLVGKIVLLNDAAAVVGAAMQAIGFSGNSTDRKELREAQRALIKNARDGYFARFTGDIDEIKSGLLSGEYLAALIWSGDGIDAAKENSKVLSYTLPEEGSFRYVDSVGVLASSPNPDLGVAFLEYLLEPKVHSLIAAELGYQCPNLEARALLTAEILADEAVYPRGALRSKVEAYEIVNREHYERIYLRITK